MAIGTRPEPSLYSPATRPSGPGLDPASGAEGSATEPGVAARVFYRVDSRKVTLREYWWERPSSVPLAALLKLLRVSVTGATDDPCVASLAPFEVAPESVPRVVAQRFASAMGQLAALGFHSPVWHVVEDDVQRGTTHLATLVHRSGRAWARVHNRVWHVRTPATSKLFVELVSETSPGRFLWSLSAKPDLSAPPSCTVVRKADAAPGQLWGLHEAALRKVDVAALVAVRTPDELRAAVERLHAAVRDFHVQRGVFVPVTADDDATAATFRDRVRAAAEGGSQYPEIMAEIDRLQQGSSRKNGIILLLISLGLFVGAGLTSVGGNRFSLDVLAILVVVLFFHELGHWLAMRTFGYRDLKMFFIPFFGAAVSGRHHNVPGWKKAVVSLMGPLPGIVVGTAVGLVGLATGSALMVKIALVALILNGLNLLPVLPMDGGWVLQAILLSRHHLLELVFRIVAIVALFAGGAYTDDYILRGLAIMMAVSLPAMHRVARITNELRHATLPPIADDDQAIPRATAEAIVARIKQGFPTGLSNTNAAQFAISVFENLNARPPGALASVGLGVLQLASLATAIVVSAILFMGGIENVGDLKGATTMRDGRTLDPATLVEWRSPGDPVLAAEPHDAVLATFPTPDDARAAGAELRDRISRHMGLAGLGQTLVLTLPTADSAGRVWWQEELARRGAEVSVSHASAPAMVMLSCDAASIPAGDAMERELGDYFATGGMHLVPPWLASERWSPEERARFTRARHTHSLLLRSRGDAEQARALRAAGDVDPAVVRAFELLERDSVLRHDPAHRAAALGPLLGQLPMMDGAPRPGRITGSATGFASRDELSLLVTLMPAENTTHASFGIVRWLAGRGCGGMRYSIVPRSLAPTGDD